MNPYTSSGSVATMTANVSGNDSLNDLGDGPRQPGDPERYPVGAVTRRLLGYVRPHRISFTASFVSAAISVILQLYTPILIGEGIDLIVAAGQVDFDALLPLVTKLAIVVVGAAAFQWLQGYCVNRLSYETVRDMRVEASDKLSRMPLSFIDSHAHGDLMSRVVNDVDQVGDGLLQGFTQLFTGVITIVGTLAFMLSINLAMTLVVVLVTPLSIFAAGAIAKLSNKSFTAQQRIQGQLGGHIEEYVGEQKLVDAFAYGPHAQQRFDVLNAELYTAGERAQFMGSLSNPGTRFINNIIYAVVAVIGCVGVITGVPAALTVGGVQIFLSYANQYTKPFNEVTNVITQIQTAYASARRMFALLDAREQEPDAADAVELAAPQGEVTFEHVDFSYVPDRKLLQDICIDAKPGTRFALVGPTGCGKTTLINLLLRFYDIDAGRIAVDGRSSRDYTRASLRRAFGMVLQDTWLFEGTVAENIAYGCPDATREQIVEAAKRAHAHKFIVQLPGGYDTVIGEDGGTFSQGQKQLLCIARVMLTDPAILLLDEATSSIDTRTELQVQAAFDELMAGRTSFVVAHRLSTIVGADQILVLERGRIAEHGTHGELLATAGAYARMWNSQEQLSAYAYAEGDAEDVGAVEAVDGSAACTDGLNGASSSSAAAALDSGRVRRSAPSIMWRMMGLVRPLAGWLVLAVALGSIGMLTAAFVPAFGALGLMAALGYNALGLGLVAACAACAACGIARGPLHYGEQLCNHYIAFRLLAHIRNLVFGALRQLAPAKLEGRGKGELVSLVTSDIELLEVFYAHTISPIAIALVCTVVFEGFLLAVSPELAGIALVAYAVLGVLLPLTSAKACGTTGRQSREGAGKLGAFVLDSLRGASETIQFAGGADRSRALSKLTEQVGAVDARLKRRQAASEAVADALILAANLVMLGRALQLVSAGTIDFAAAFVAVFTFVSSFGSVMAVSRLGASLQETLASGARVLDLLDEQPQCAEVADGQNVEFAGAAAEHVSFSYVGGVDAGGAGATEQVANDTAASLILDDVTCTFAPGTMTCIMGRSGSGKSTLLKLLMRFWDPAAGTITVSGVDARHINTASLRSHEAYMTQDTHLFCGTVRENLLVAHANATDAELLDACRSASLTTLIDRLPQGLDTPVAELGDSLSGGERQRIGLARIFLNDAPFILLDEPTSALDALNEASVMQAIDELKRRGKTIVLVSHRASTCAFADFSLSVEHGRLS